MSLRTVFHQFSDLEQVHRGAGERVVAQVRALHSPVDPALPLAARVAAFTAGRAHALVAITPVSAAARLREWSSPELRANRTRMLAMSAAELRAVFAPELAGLGPAGRERCLAALGALTSWSGWRSLTEELGLDEEQAAATLRGSLAAVLSGRAAFDEESTPSP